MQLVSAKNLALIALAAVSLFAAYSALSRQPTAYTTATAMADQKVIVQFKKTSTAEDRQKAVAELTGKGAKVVDNDNIDSKIFPFITVELPEADFSIFESQFGGGSHDVVQHVEVDGKVYIQ